MPTGRADDMLKPTCAIPDNNCNYNVSVVLSTSGKVEMKPRHHQCKIVPINAKLNRKKEHNSKGIIIGNTSVSLVCYTRVLPYYFESQSLVLRSTT
jgi:hypothetical protein